MHSTGLARWVVGMIVLLQVPIHGQTSDSPLSVSLDRIRAALEAPQPILPAPTLTRPTPTFRGEIRQPGGNWQPSEEHLFDPTFGLPSAGELLMDGIEKIRSSAVNYMRHRAQRRARREV